MSLIETARTLLTECNKASESPVVLDGGCHRGLFSEAVVNAFPQAQILAFEPDPDNFRTAAERLAHHSRFHIVNAALGGARARAEFFRGERDATNSLLPRPSHGGQPYYPAAATLEGGSLVDVVTIDDELDQRDIDHVDILKLDLQGGELAALKGASRLLSRAGAHLVITEAMFVAKYESQPLLWKTWGFLDSFGYSLFSLEDIKIGPYDECGGMRAKQWNQSDAIYLSPALRSVLDGHTN